MFRRTTISLVLAAGLAVGAVTDASAANGAAGLGPAPTATASGTGGAGLVAAVHPKPKLKAKPRHVVHRKKPAARPKPKPKRAVRKVKPKPNPKPTLSRPRPITPIPTPAATGTVTGAQILAYAERYVSTPYEYGGNGPRTFDCSGFTSYVFAHFGYQLDRSSYDQMKQGVPVHGSLQLGDLVFWDDGGHVGIYAGNDTFISATVHKGIWTYSFDVWKQTQSYTTARRILGDSALIGTGGTSGGTYATAARAMPRNGGPADATP